MLGFHNASLIARRKARRREGEAPPEPGLPGWPRLTTSPPNLFNGLRTRRSIRKNDSKGVTSQASATREAPAQAELRPTCAGYSRANLLPILTLLGFSLALARPTAERAERRVASHVIESKRLKRSAQTSADHPGASIVQRSLQPKVRLPDETWIRGESVSSRLPVNGENRSHGLSSPTPSLFSQRLPFVSISPLQQ
jgi:hypothetical protein